MSTSTFGVRTCVLADGQRIPLLVDGKSGLPLEATTRYTLAKRWQVGCSSGTAAVELRSIALLMTWAARLGIDVDARIDRGEYFSFSEIEALVDALRERRPDVSGAAENIVFVGLDAAARKIARAEPRRHVVSNETWYQRIKYAQSYLRWRIDDAISRVPTQDDRFYRIRQRADEVIAKLEALLPATTARHREGLGAELRSRFLEVIDPNHPDNPFQKASRFRNYVLLRLIFETGCRLGEALGLYTTDYRPDARRPTLAIHRRPHNPLDLRVDLPLVKTRSRVLPLSTKMADLLETLITGDRKALPGAKKTPFIFLARDGSPLARRSVDDMPPMIRKAFPEFARLTIHVLRHDWNDRFSDLAREKGWSEEKETQHRNYLQGWQKTSKQGLNYSRRSTREEAIRAALELQRRDWETLVRE